MIDAIETCPNPGGLVALNPDDENSVLAVPDLEKGYIKINNYEKNTTRRFEAHERALFAMCLNYEGNLLCTASEKGTLLRIFSTENGEPLMELRRGKENAKVHTLCFDRKSKFLACTSDRSTIHIFSINIDS